MSGKKPSASMPQCIAAVFTAALEFLQALFSPPKSRHAGRRLSKRPRRLAEARRRYGTAPVVLLPGLV